MIPTVRDFRRGKGKGRNDGTPGNQSSKLGYQTWTIQHHAEVGMEARRPDPKGSFAGRLPYAAARLRRARVPKARHMSMKLRGFSHDIRRHDNVFIVTLRGRLDVCAARGLS